MKKKTKKKVIPIPTCQYCGKRLPATHDLPMDVCRDCYMEISDLIAREDY